MLITKEIEIDAGHRIPNHKSKCFSLHGHRYRIEVGVDDKIITTKNVSDEGMVIDFGDLKQIMLEEIDLKCDHSFILYSKDLLFENWINDPLYNKMKIYIVDFIPTVENLAKHWYELLEKRLDEKNIKLKYVRVWETPTSSAIWESKDVS